MALHISASLRVSQCLVADGKSFVTRAVQTLPLNLEGIPGDVHYGFTRLSGGREFWHPRRTPIRNDRHLTLVSAAELAQIAVNVIDGIENLTQLPRGVRLLFASGTTLYLNGENHPCRGSGAQVAGHFPDRTGLDLMFVKAAAGLRGLIAVVERAGDIGTGDVFKLRKA